MSECENTKFTSIIEERLSRNRRIGEVTKEPSIIFIPLVARKMEDSVNVKMLQFIQEHTHMYWDWGKAIKITYKVSSLLGDNRLTWFLTWARCMEKWESLRFWSCAHDNSSVYLSKLWDVVLFINFGRRHMTYKDQWKCTPSMTL